MKRVRVAVVVAMMGAAVVATVLVAAGVWAFAPRPSTADQVFAGRFGPTSGIVVKNLTVADGRYLLDYSMDVYVAPNARSIGVVCTVEDTSGRIAALPGLVRPVASGRWVTISAQDVFELPDLTLGIRCFAEQDALLVIAVRNALLTARSSNGN